MIVRPIDGLDELDKVYRLTHDAYREKGYIEARPDGRLIHYPHLDNIPETTVLVAVENGAIIGTNSVTIDGPAGLHCESDFPMQVQRERWRPLALCCSWRIITRADVRDNFAVLYRLIKETIAEVARREHRICLMTFHPNDALVYRKLLDAEVVGFSEHTKGLVGAPALLLRCDRERLPRQWLKK